MMMLLLGVLLAIAAADNCIEDRQVYDSELGHATVNGPFWVRPSLLLETDRQHSCNVYM